MKLNNIINTFALISLALAATARAQDDGENRFSVSARFGFNFSARFHGVAVTPGAGTARKTPGGDTYNYDDGYVLTDVSGNAGGQTWYWGYDDSSKQISGNTILLTKTTGTGTTHSSNEDADAPSYGAEAVWSRHLGDIGKCKYGFELAGNYMNVDMNDNRRLPVGLTRTTDAYPFTDGTFPPIATSDAPYQGSFEGPGFLIGATPLSSTPSTGTSFSTGHRHFEADIWGLRIGPYLEYPVSDKFKVSLSGGFAGALVYAQANWSESVTVGGTAGPRVSGRGHDNDFLLGAYVAGNAAYQFDEHWSVIGSVQFQYLQDYSANFAGRKVTADLTKGIFVTIGVGYSF